MVDFEDGSGPSPKDRFTDWRDACTNMIIPQIDTLGEIRTVHDAPNGKIRIPGSRIFIDTAYDLDGMREFFARDSDVTATLLEEINTIAGTNYTDIEAILDLETYKQLYLDHGISFRLLRQEAKESPAVAQSIREQGGPEGGGGGNGAWAERVLGKMNEEFFGKDRPNDPMEYLYEIFTEALEARLNFCIPVEMGSGEDALLNMVDELLKKMGCRRFMEDPTCISQDLNPYPLYVSKDLILTELPQFLDRFKDEQVLKDNDDLVEKIRIQLKHCRPTITKMRLLDDFHELLGTLLVDHIVVNPFSPDPANPERMNGYVTVGSPEHVLVLAFNDFMDAAGLRREPEDVTRLRLQPPGDRFIISNDFAAKLQQFLLSDNRFHPAFKDFPPGVSAKLFLALDEYERAKGFITCDPNQVIVSRLDNARGNSLYQVDKHEVTLHVVKDGNYFAPEQIIPKRKAVMIYSEGMAGLNQETLSDALLRAEKDTVAQGNCFRRIIAGGDFDECETTLITVAHPSSHWAMLAEIYLLMDEPNKFYSDKVAVFCQNVIMPILPVLSDEEDFSVRGFVQEVAEILSYIHLSGFSYGPCFIEQCKNYLYDTFLTGTHGKGFEHPFTKEEVDYMMYNLTGMYYAGTVDILKARAELGEERGDSSVSLWLIAQDGVVDHVTHNCDLLDAPEMYGHPDLKVRDIAGKVKHAVHHHSVIVYPQEVHLTRFLLLYNDDGPFALSSKEMGKHHFRTLVNSSTGTVFHTNDSVVQRVAREHNVNPDEIRVQLVPSNPAADPCARFTRMAVKHAGKPDKGKILMDKFTGANFQVLQARDLGRYGDLWREVSEMQALEKEVTNMQQGRHVLHVESPGASSVVRWTK